jgi:hypothetical protein
VSWRVEWRRGPAPDESERKNAPDSDGRSGGSDEHACYLWPATPPGHLNPGTSQNLRWQEDEHDANEERRVCDGSEEHPHVASSGT